MANLERLSELTKEIADEVHNESNGNVFNLLCLVFDKLKTFCMILDKDSNMLYINPVAKKFFKSKNLNYKNGMKWYDMWETSHPYKNNCPHKRAIKTRKVITERYVSPITNITYDITAIPLIYNGVSGTICLIVPDGG